MLEVVNANLLAGHRITRILSVLKIPRSTTMIIYIGSQVELNAAGIITPAKGEVTVV